MPPEQADPPASAPARPHFRQTTGETPHEPAVRPWELELLISGAVTFALLQLPGRLDGLFDALLPRQDRLGTMVLMLLYYYGKMILYVLIGGFGTHLAARAYWVGLIGLESVFPNGVDWDRTRYGPVLREVYSRRIGGLQPLIDRADRFCSMIFPAAFSMVMVFLFSVAAVGTAGGIAFGLSQLFGTRVMGIAYFGIMLGWAALSAVVTLVDRRLAPRMDPAGRPYRLLQRIGPALYWGSGMPIFGAVWMTLFSNLPRRVFMGGLWLGMGGLLAFGLVKDLLLRDSSAGLDGYRYVLDGGSRTMSAAHYDNLRPPGAVLPVPSIQSDVVTGPYVRLFIPYAPRRLNPAIAERCPGLPRPDRSLRLGSAAGDTLPLGGQNAIIDCWSRLQPVRLNGRPLAPSYRFFEHPRTGMHGLVAYLPGSALRPGENVLEVENPPRPREQRLPPRPPYVIPFWR